MRATDFSFGLTAERLRCILHYDPQTGFWTWLVRKSQVAKIGSRAGCLNPDTLYAEITIDGHCYKSHRLAWLYMTGKWPEDQIDHENLKRNDNRWENLRPANNKENQANRGPTARNTSGLKGVSWTTRNQKWCAQICLDRRNIHLGYFNDPHEAHAAYVKASAKYFGQFARAA